VRAKRASTRWLLPALFVALAVVPGPAFAADQTSGWQHDAGRAGAPQNAGLGPPFERRWTKQLVGDHISYPLIAPGRAVVTVADEDRYGTKLMSLDADTGRTVWTRQVPGRFRWSAPASDRGLIFVLNDDGIAFAFDGDTGRRLWTADTGLNGGPPAPAVAAGTVYVGGNSYGGHVVALDASTGAERWRRALGGAYASVPALDDRRVYVTGSDHSSFALDPATGAVLWKVTAPAQPFPCSPAAQAPVLLDADRLLVREHGCAGRVLERATGAVVRDLALRGIPAVAGATAYGAVGGVLGAYEVANGTVRWRFGGADGAAITAPPLVVGGHVLAGEADGTLHALDTRDGSVAWTDETDGDLGHTAEDFAGDPTSGFAAADGLLVVPSGSRVIAYADANAAADRISTRITQAPRQPTSASSATFAFASPSGATRFECRVDDGQWLPCAVRHTIESVSVGRHHLRVRAIDASGHRDPTPSAHGWTVNAPERAGSASSPAGPYGEAWRRNLGGDVSNVLEGDGRVFLLHRGPETIDPVDLVALDAGDGRELWRHRLENPAGGATKAGFAYEGGRLFVRIGADGRVQGRSAATGAIEWETPLQHGKAWNGRPAVADGRVLVEGDGYGSYLHALDQDSGRLLWRTHLAYSGGGGTPGVDGDTVYVAYSSCAAVHAVDLVTGARVWSAGKTECSAPSTSPQLRDGRLFVAGNELDRFDGALVGRFQAEHGPLFGANTMVSYSTTMLRAHDEDTGRLRWERPFSWSDGRPYAVVGDDAVLIVRGWLTTVSLADGSTTSERQLDAFDYQDFVRITPRTGGLLVGYGGHLFSFRHDDVAPQTTITAGPPALTSDAEAVVGFMADGAARFECALDGRRWSACDSPVRAVTGDGDHVLRVRAADDAGNVEATPAVHRWTVDTIAPDTWIDRVEGTGRTREAHFAASEQHATFLCRLDSGSWSGCTSPLRLDGLVAGTHRLEVLAADRAGNQDTTPADAGWTVAPLPEEQTHGGQTSEGDTAQQQTADAGSPSRAPHNQPSAGESPAADGTTGIRPSTVDASRADARAASRRAAALLRRIGPRRFGARGARLVLVARPNDRIAITLRAGRTLVARRSARTTSAGRAVLKLRATAAGGRRLRGRKTIRLVLRLVLRRPHTPARVSSIVLRLHPARRR
jgi:outer membrane protein assembly factor BamB